VGPLAGLAAGLSALEGSCELAVVVPCDSPLIHPAVIRFIATALVGSSRGVAALTGPSGQPRPFPAAWRTSLAGRGAEAVTASQSRPWMIAAESLEPISRAGLTADPEVARCDPDLESLRDADDQAAFADLADSPPRVRVSTGGRRHALAAWTLAEVIAEVGREPDAPCTVNGSPVAQPARFALARGDTVAIG
jgi:hypothetical protein